MAPDDMDNVLILPLEGKPSLLLQMRFWKSKARHRHCAAAVLTGVATV